MAWLVVYSETQGQVAVLGALYKTIQTSADIRCLHYDIVDWVVATWLYYDMKRLKYMHLAHSHLISA